MKENAWLLWGWNHFFFGFKSFLPIFSGPKLIWQCATGHSIFMSTYKYLQFIMIKIGSFVTAKRFRKFLIPETSILESIHVKVKPQNRSFTFLENLDFEFFHVLELILEKLSDLLLLSIERHLFMLRRRLRLKKRLNWRYDHLWRVIYRGDKE